MAYLQFLDLVRKTRHLKSHSHGPFQLHTEQAFRLRACRLDTILLLGIGQFAAPRGAVGIAFLVGIRASACLQRLS